MLAHTPGETRISDVILAVDEPIRATRCMPGQPFGCRGNQSRCQTHDLWEELGNQIYLYLSSVTIDDVISRRVLGTSGLAKSDGAAGDAAAETPGGEARNPAQSRQVAG
jgi:Rrf2 family iron-sulfur cluster assembly transcriptional regulator